MKRMKSGPFRQRERSLYWLPHLRSGGSMAQMICGFIRMAGSTLQTRTIIESTGVVTIKRLKRDAVTTSHPTAQKFGLQQMDWSGQLGLPEFWMVKHFLLPSSMTGIATPTPFFRMALSLTASSLQNPVLTA